MRLSSFTKASSRAWGVLTSSVLAFLPQPCESRRLCGSLGSVCACQPPPSQPAEQDATLPEASEAAVDEPAQSEAPDVADAAEAGTALEGAEARSQEEGEEEDPPVEVEVALTLGSTEPDVVAAGPASGEPLPSPMAPSAADFGDAADNTTAPREGDLLGL